MKITKSFDSGQASLTHKCSCKGGYSIWTHWQRDSWCVGVSQWALLYTQPTNQTALYWWHRAIVWWLYLPQFLCWHSDSYRDSGWSYGCGQHVFLVARRVSSWIEWNRPHGEYWFEVGILSDTSFYVFSTDGKRGGILWGCGGVRVWGVCLRGCALVGGERGEQNRGVWLVTAIQCYSERTIVECWN